MSADHKARGGVSEAEGLPLWPSDAVDRVAYLSVALAKALSSVEILERARDRYATLYGAAEKRAVVAEARAAKAVERVKALEEALRPFAKGFWTYQNAGQPVWCYPDWSEHDRRYLCTVGDIQRAATLLSYHPAPEPGVETGEVRNAVLEEAAKVAQEVEVFYPYTTITARQQGIKDQIAAAIRALQTPANGGRDG